MYSRNVGILLNWLGMMLKRSLEERSRFSGKKKIEISGTSGLKAHNYSFTYRHIPSLLNASIPEGIAPDIELSCS